jgi:hypothetical protein
MKLLRHDLQADEDYQGSEEESGPGQIAPVERHGDGIAAGFAECRCGDFNNPESERYFGNLVE